MVQATPHESYLRAINPSYALVVQDIDRALRGLKLWVSRYKLRPADSQQAPHFNFTLTQQPRHSVLKGNALGGLLKMLGNRRGPKPKKAIKHGFEHGSLCRLPMFKPTSAIICKSAATFNVFNKLKWCNILAQEPQ